MPCRAVRVRRGADADTVNRPRARRSVTLYAASKTTASEGLRTGTRNWQAMQSGTHFAKTGGFRSHGTRLFHACWGAAPIPAEHKSCVLERRINPAATRFCKSLMGRQLNAAPPLVPVVHSFPPAPCPVPEYGRYWPWLSAALSYPRGLFGTRYKPPFSPPSARRTPYSVP